MLEILFLCSVSSVGETDEETTVAEPNDDVGEHDLEAGSVFGGRQNSTPWPPPPTGHGLNVEIP